MGSKGKACEIGIFDSEEEAALRYDQVAISLGKTILNFSPAPIAPGQDSPTAAPLTLSPPSSAASLGLGPNGASAGPAGGSGRTHPPPRAGPSGLEAINSTDPSSSMSAQKIKTERGAARHTNKKIRISYTTSTSAPTTDAGTSLPDYDEEIARLKLLIRKYEMRDAALIAELRLEMEAQVEEEVRLELQRRGIRPPNGVPSPTCTASIDSTETNWSPIVESATNETALEELEGIES